MLEEKQQLSVQTIVLVAFDKSGGLQITLQILKIFWQEADKLSSIAEVSDDIRSIASRVYDGIKIILHFLKAITLPKALLTSLQTVGLSSREKDREKPDYFNSNEFIIRLRSFIFPSIKDLWSSDILYKMPCLNAKSLIQILSQAFKTDGELNEKTENTTSLVLFNHRALSGPSEDRIRQLCDMGFIRSAAETALAQSGNHLSTATEYLLAHPELNQDAGTSRSHGNSDLPSNYAASSQNEQVNSNLRDASADINQDLSFMSLLNPSNSAEQNIFSTRRTTIELFLIWML